MGTGPELLKRACPRVTESCADRIIVMIIMRIMNLYNYLTYIRVFRDSVFFAQICIYYERRREEENMIKTITFLIAIFALVSGAFASGNASDSAVATMAVADP
jgi:hypothetical protein